MSALIVVTTSVAIVACWLGNEIRESKRLRDVAAKIQEYGGGVAYDWEVTPDGAFTTGDGNLVTWGNTPPAPAWLRRLFGENLFSELVYVGFDLMDEGADLSGLQYADSLPDLKHVYIGWGTLTDDALANLGGLDTIETLTIENATLVDKHLSNLASMRRLRRLRLSSTGITDKGLAAIAHLDRLEMLDLTETEIHGAGLVYLGRMPRLQRVYLGRTKVTDESLRHLASLQSIRCLGLADTGITDTGLRHLAGLVHLDTLDVTNSLVTERGVADIRRMLPELQEVMGP